MELKKPKDRLGRTVEQIERDNEREWQNWYYHRDHGGSDPFYADGVNMDLIRNHIIYNNKALDELQRVPVQIGMFNTEKSFAKRKVPPKMPMDYMAKKQQIEQDARDAFEAMKADDDLPGYFKKTIPNLERSIAESNYVDMRRCAYQWQRHQKERSA